LHSTDIHCVSAHVDHVHLSDHYPVWANLQLP